MKHETSIKKIGNFIPCPKKWAGKMIPVPGNAGRVVGIEQWRGKLIIATENGVYQYDGRKTTPVAIINTPPPQHKENDE